MVEVFTPVKKVGPGIEAGNGPEVVDKMRLVEIPAGQSDVHPLDLLLSSDTAQHLLKALDTAKKLWRQPHFFMEHLDEPSRAEADALGHITYRSGMRYLLELLQREGNSGMTHQRPG